MSKFEYILFDLDGTLVDSGLGITNSVMYALNQFGIPSPPREELYKFIGPPLVNSFIEYHGFSLEDALKALKEYRVYYNKKGIFENTVYTGIPELLGSLNHKGKKIILATSKPEIMAEKILKHYDLYKYFDSVVGATLDEKLSEKADIIAYALKINEIEDTDKVVMVGDREHDIIGARNNNLESIGVLYGYGNYEELANAGATHIANTVENINKFI